MKKYNTIGEILFPSAKITAAVFHRNAALLAYVYHFQKSADFSVKNEIFD